MLGISIKPTIGIGDALQFSSTPQNYFAAKGEMLIDVSKPWFFDHNPFLMRTTEKATETLEMWNFGPRQREWVTPREAPAPAVFLSNAEVGASFYGVPVTLNRPRLYRFEDFPYERREMILLHVQGRSHGAMPRHVVEHVLKKYGPTKKLFIVGPSSVDYGIPAIKTETLWDLAELISQARMLIGVDSGPAWIAACYPDVIVKKIRTKPSIDVLRSWTPLEIRNIHSHWDDRCHHIFNISDHDVGFTSSYRKI